MRASKLFRAGTGSQPHVVGDNPTTWGYNPTTWDKEEPIKKNQKEELQRYYAFFENRKTGGSRGKIRATRTRLATARLVPRTAIFEGGYKSRYPGENFLHWWAKASLPVSERRSMSYQGECEEAEGYIKIARAVIALAVKDASNISKEQRHRAHTARFWLAGWECQNLCELLGYEHERILKFLETLPELPKYDSRKATEPQCKAQGSFITGEVEIESLRVS